MSPSFGPTASTPSPRRIARFRCVAGCCHIRTFIAGATSTRLSVAISTVEARSFACPPAIFAIRSAVQGATTSRSASRESSICPIPASSVRSNRSRYTFSAASALADNGVTNSSAARVSTGTTVAPRSRSRRIRSSDLNAAMPPPTIRSIRLPASMTSAFRFAASVLGGQGAKNNGPPHQRSVRAAQGSSRSAGSVTSQKSYGDSSSGRLSNCPRVRTRSSGAA